MKIGCTKTQVAVGTPDGRIIDRRRFHVDRDRGAQGIRDCLSAAIAALAEQWQPVAVGAGFGGPIDWRTGRIAHSHHVAGWDGFPLADWLAERADATAFVKNDANTAALGEARYGAGRGHDPVFYVTIGSGVGGGLVCGGSIYHGAPPGEAEIGHLRLDPEGRTTEALCSGWSLDARIRAAVARRGDVLLAASVSGGSPNLVKVFEWANDQGLETAAIVGAKRGRLAEIARQAIVVADTHYGRVEDVQMNILHMLCYAFMELPALAAP